MVCMCYDSLLAANMSATIASSPVRSLDFALGLMSHGNAIEGASPAFDGPVSREETKERLRKGKTEGSDE